MKFRSFFLAFSIFALVLAIDFISTGKAQAAVFCVDDASDGAANPADCAETCDGTNDCSLRDAIEAADVDAVLDNIIFQIPGAGVHTIPLTTSLSISNPVMIDGYTQPGATPNTLSDGNNAVLLIELDGTSMSKPNLGGLIVIFGGGTTIKGLVMNRNAFGAGISMYSKGGNTIEGNFIGTDPTGMIGQGNSSVGIIVADQEGNNVVGGTTPAARNIVSDNETWGIVVSSSENTIQGNFIGTNALGDSCLGNTYDGISLGSGGNNIVGGIAIGAGNVTSCNNFGGISIHIGSGDQIQGNFIGTNLSGTLDLGNVFAGISTGQNASGMMIGGAVNGAGNTIAFNGTNGIQIFDGTSVTILGNSIFSNDQLAIDIEGNGVTGNDIGDTDIGPNNLQNFPVLSSAIFANSELTIEGNLDSSGADFRIEFFANDECDDSGNGEGQTFLGAADVSSGNFDVVLPVALLNQQFITATATNNLTNDTSEFSACIQVTSPMEDCANGSDDDGDNLVDCSDPDCGSDVACVSPLTEICDNNFDDDGDGLSDCIDPDCMSDTACNSSGVSPITEICDNSLDDDGDGNIDCNDSDCNTFCSFLSGGGCSLSTAILPIGSSSGLFLALISLALFRFSIRRLQ